MKAGLFICAVVLCCSCAGLTESEAPFIPEITDFRTGKWVNIHANDPDLVGADVQQFPDCQYDAKQYEGNHPAMVIYVFKGGQAHQLGYQPDGAIREDFWWDVPADDGIWNRLEKP